MAVTIPCGLTKRAIGVDKKKDKVPAWTTECSVCVFFLCDGFLLDETLIWPQCVCVCMRV